MRFPLALFAALAVVGCSSPDIVPPFPDRGGEPPTGPVQVTPPTQPPAPPANPPGTLFDVMVNGALWTAQGAISVTRNGRVLEIASAGIPGIERMTLVIRLNDVDGPGV